MLFPPQSKSTVLRIPRCQRAKTQSVELDEAFGVLLVVGTGVVLEHDELFGI